MIFETKVHGIPCLCKVIHYSSYVPMKIYGLGIGDATEPVSEEFEFAILDSKERKAPWLEKYLKPEDSDRLCEEFLFAVKAEEFN